MLVIPASFMAIYGKKDKKEGQRDKRLLKSLNFIENVVNLGRTV